MEFVKHDSEKKQSVVDSRRDAMKARMQGRASTRESVDSQRDAMKARMQERAMQRAKAAQTAHIRRAAPPLAPRPS